MKPPALPALIRQLPWLPLAALACLVIVLRPVFDYDLYWHLAYGREIAQSGHIIDQDIFSYTQPGTHFDNRYWLAQWIFFRLWDWFGGAGPLALKLGITALVATLLFRTSRHLGAGSGVAALTTVLAVLAGVFRYAERPEIFTLLLFALLGYLLAGYQTGRLRARWLALVPLIMLAWDWLHGGVYGFGLLAAHVGVANLRARLKPAADAPALRPLNLAFAASLAAMALNPFGLATYGVFFEQAVQSRAALDQNMEYRAPDWQNYKAFFVMLGWGALLTALRWRAASLAQGLAALGLAFLAWRISRVTGVFALAAAPYIAGLLAAQLAEPPWKKHLARASLIAVAVLVGVQVVLLKFVEDSPQRLGWQVDDQFLPAGAVRFVEAKQITGNLYNSGDIGGYLAFAMYPARRIFHYNHGQIFGDTWRYASHPQELEHWGIDHAIVSDPDELKILFPPGEWARVYRDPGAVLVVRRLSQYAELIREHELRYFHPMLPVQNYFNLAANPGVRPVLARETAVYLAFRRDIRMARALVRVLGQDPALAGAPDIAPYLRLAQRFNSEVPGFAALASGT